MQGSPPDVAPDPVRGWLNIGLTVLVLSCVLVIVVSAVLRWIWPTVEKQTADSPVEVSSDVG